jgi:hypothetical protein
MSEEQITERAGPEQGQLVMPFYLICDVSGSMSGDMATLNQEVQRLRAAIVSEPTVDDVAHVCVMTFGSACGHSGIPPGSSTAPPRCPAFPRRCGRTASVPSRQHRLPRHRSLSSTQQARPSPMPSQAPATHRWPRRSWSYGSCPVLRPLAIRCISRRQARACELRPPSQRRRTRHANRGAYARPTVRDKNGIWR